MNNTMSTRKIVMNGLMIALVFLVTRATVIPIGVSVFNLGDAAIMVAAVYFGRNSSFAAGAIGSALSDVASGYGFYAPLTFIVKGIEGYVIGYIANSSTNKKTSEARKIIALIAGSIIMVGGYFLMDRFVLGLYSSNGGYAWAIGDLIPGNVTQGIVCPIIGYILITIFNRSGVNKLLE